MTSSPCLAAARRVAPRALPCVAAGALAIALAACHKRDLTFEERFHSANLAAVPGEKLAACMVKKLKPSAAFTIGQHAARENARIEGLIIQPADRNKISFNGPDVQELLDDAGEALAVACGVDRADWRARSPYLMLDGGENTITDRGIEVMSYGIAMSEFQKRLAALPAFAQGTASVEAERAAEAAHRQHLEEVHVQTEAERMREFAVQPEPNASTSAAPAREQAVPQ